MDFAKYQEKIKKEKANPGIYLKDDTHLLVEVAGLITRARVEKGWTQEELAKRIDTKQSSISRVENGSVYPSIPFLKRIADAVGTYLIPPKFGFMEEVKSLNLMNEGSYVTTNAPFHHRETILATDKSKVTKYENHEFAN